MKQDLVDYGLSDKEADIYLICLRVGQATANRIAELANLARSTTYDLLERLNQRGLISTCVVKNKTNFIASDPTVLINLLDDKKEKIKKILPDLKGIHNTVGEKPKVEVYEGKVALTKLLDEILDNSSSLKLIGNLQKAVERMGYHPDKFRMIRRQKKIPIKQIQELSFEARKIKEDKYTKIRFLPSLKKAGESTFISDNAVYHLILLEEITAIKVLSKEHANSMGIIFDELWQEAKYL